MNRLPRTPSNPLPISSESNSLDYRYAPANPRLNVRLLVGTIVVVAGAAGCVVAMQRHQLRKMTGTIRQLADAAEQNGDTRNSTRHLRTYVALAPHDLDARLRLATSQHERRMSRHSLLHLLQVFEDVLRADPRRHAVRKNLIKQLCRVGRFHDALEHCELALAQEPDDRDVLLIQAECLHATRAFANAADVYAALIALDDSDPSPAIRLAALLRLQEEPVRARRVLNRLIEAHPENAAGYLARARYRAADGNFSGAADDVDRATELEPNNTAVQFSVIELGYSQRDPSIVDDPRTVSRLKRMLSSVQRAGSRATVEQGQPDAATICRLIGQLETRSGHFVEARRWFRKGLLHSSRLDLRVRLIETMIAQGDTDKAYEEIEAAQATLLANGVTHLPSRLNLLPRLLAAGADMESKEWSRAAETLEDVRINTRDASLLDRADEWLAICYHELRQPEDEILVHERLLKRHPLALESRRALAAALACAGSILPALDNYRLAVTAANGTWSTESALVELARRQADPAQSLAVLRMADDECRDTAAVLRSFVTCWTHRIVDRSDVSLVDIEARMDSLKPGERVLLRQCLTHAYTSVKDSAAADRHWQRIRESEAADAEALTQCFVAALRRGESDSLGEHIERLRQIEGNNGPCLQLCLALQLVEKELRQGHRDARREGPIPAHVQEALDRFEDVTAARPDWHSAFLYRGLTYEAIGHKRRALADYRRAFELGSTETSFLVRLVTILNGERSHEAANRSVLHYLSHGGTIPTDDFARLASSVARQAADDQQAVRMARHAVAIDPQDARNHIALGRLLLRRGKSHESEHALRRATELSEQELDAWYDLARVLIRNERKPQAEALMVEANERLSESSRHRLAMQLASGRYDEFLLALHLLPDANDAEASDHGLLLRARVLANRPFTVHLEEARRLLEDLHARRSLLRQDRMRLAALYDREGKLEDADQLRSELLQTDGHELEVWSNCVAHHIASGKYAEAERLLDRIQPAITTQEEATINILLRSRLDAHRGQTDVALRRLASFVERTTETDERRRRSLRVAQFLHGLSKEVEVAGPPLLDAAKGWYERAIAIDPSSVVAYARFLLRNRRARDVIDLALEPERDVETRHALIPCAVAALTQSDVDRDIVKPVAKLVESAVAGRPESVELLISMGALREFQGDDRAAQDCWRRALAVSPTNVTALSRLARLLKRTEPESTEARTLVDKAIGIVGPIDGLAGAQLSMSSDDTLARK